MTVATSAAFQQWEYESKLIADALTRAERTEYAILASLGCPIEPGAVYAILAGEQAAPWLKRDAKRDRQRVLHALHVLAWLAETRRHLALGQENARLAARAALMVGLYAGDAAINAAHGVRMKTRNQAAAQRRGRDIRDEAASRRIEILEAVRQYDARRPDQSVRTRASNVARALSTYERPVSAGTIVRYLYRKNPPQ